jgi:uracil-DNA glycosylase family 4
VDKLAELYSQLEPLIDYRGNPDSNIMIVDSLPDEQEYKLHKPLLGKKGALLRLALDSVSLSDSDDVYITSLIKSPCKPTKTNIRYWGGYLKTEINLVKPKMVLLLDKYAWYSIFEEDVKPSQQIGLQENLDEVTYFLSCSLNYLVHQKSLATDKPRYKFWRLLWQITQE